MDLTEEQQADLWRLRAEWIGVYNVSVGERWRAQRIDHFSEGPDDWLFAKTADELDAKMAADYAERSVRQ